MEKYLINDGCGSITVLVTRTRSYSKITYRADAKYLGCIKATVPFLMPPKEVDKFFAENAEKLRALLKRAQESMYTQNFASGDYVPFFGSNLRLTVRRIPEAMTDWMYEVLPGEFIVTLFGAHAANPQITDNSSFRCASADEVKKRACVYIDKYASSMGAIVSKLSVRDMDTRWGSVRPKQNSMSLSSRLFMYPESCLEAVVVHELAHYKHLDHSREFYDRMTEFMPSWKGPDDLLENRAYPYERMARLKNGESEPQLF